VPKKPCPRTAAALKEYLVTEIHDLLNQIDVNQVASLLGTDPATAQSAVEAAMPTLLAGMHTNAQAPDGAASLQSALGQHQDGLRDGGVDVSQVDTADGEKIVGHVFGGQQDQGGGQASQPGGAGAGGAGAGAGTSASEERPAGQRPDAAEEPGLQRLPGERSVQPSEAIQVDLPGGEKTPKEEDKSGGLGGLLGGLFGKK
jgi:hypothetical protein